MDNFMEKITHKFTASDMIKANSQADAAQIDAQREQLQLFNAQMEKVDTALTDIRQVNMQNLESAAEVKNLAKASVDRVGEAVKNVESESVNRIKETADKSRADMDTAVERSTTAINRAVSEGLAKLAEVQSGNGMMDEMSSKIDEMGRELENFKEYIHSEDVKIYRNVQASFVEELSAQTGELKSRIDKIGSVRGLVIIGLVISCVDLAINILKLLGLI